MTQRRGWVLQGALLLGAFSFVGAKGCVFDGDASLGSDGSGSAGKPDENGEAGAGMSSGGTGSAGKPGSGQAGTGMSSGAATSGGAGSSTGGTGSSTSGTGSGDPGAGGDSPAGGAGNAARCEQPIDSGPCDAAIPMWAYDAKQDKCVKFVFGGCEGNTNRFMTREACEQQCVDLSCPSYLQTDTVYFVAPLNRPEMACIDLAHPVHVTCSMLLPPDETVPDLPITHCAKREGTYFYAGTTLPMAEGWSECSPQEAQLVDNAPDCADLK